jgi:hypothetical protein
MDAWAAASVSADRASQLEGPRSASAHSQLWSLISLSCCLGERATLVLSLGRAGAPLAIEELGLACNAEPSDAAWRTALARLEEGRRRWRERGGR